MWHLHGSSLMCPFSARLWAALPARRKCRQMPHGTLKSSEMIGKTHTAKRNGLLGVFLLLLKLHTCLLFGLPLPHHSQSASALCNNTWQLVAASSQGSWALVRTDVRLSTFLSCGSHLSRMVCRWGKRDGFPPATTVDMSARTGPAAHLENSALLTAAPHPTPNEWEPKKALLTS